MALKLYNTLSGVKEEVRPIRDDNTIRMYICGPTVYDHSHLGHFRTFVFYDILIRYLRYLGYNVINVVNITDIDDKIINRANEEGVTYKEISERYTKSFIEDWLSLNLLIPYVMPRATYHVNDMINIIKELIRKGYAYESDGEVYFDISKFSDYGRISRQKIEELIAGYRIGVVDKKKNPLDFALWKESKAGEPYWDSPWGKGRPGWHIECTTMSVKYLDPPFEIHGGGEDLKFPHHEDERAQSNAYIGDEVARIWTHVGLFKLGEEKMSKSLRNIITIKEALKIYNPDVIRIFYLSTHYRKQQIYNDEKLREANNIFDKIVRTYNHLLNAYEKSIETDDEVDINKFRRKFLEALDDDLNTPKALSIFMSFISRIESYLSTRKEYSRRLLDDAIKFFQEFKEIFGLRFKPKREVEKLDEVIRLIIDIRSELRRRRIYDLSDEIRDKLEKLGIILEDRGLETTYYIR